MEMTCSRMCLFFLVTTGGENYTYYLTTWVALITEVLSITSLYIYLACIRKDIIKYNINAVYITIMRCGADLYDILELILSFINRINWLRL